MCPQKAVCCLFRSYIKRKTIWPSETYDEYVDRLQIHVVRYP